MVLFVRVVCMLVIVVALSGESEMWSLHYTGE